MSKNSQAERVCTACFGGNKRAMLEHANRYLQEGHQSVPDLGKDFRDIVKSQNREVWWTRARDFLHEQVKADGLLEEAMAEVELDAIVRLVSAVERVGTSGKPMILTRRGRPVAAVISIEDLERLR